MLNSSWSASYKNLANKTDLRECSVSERPFSEIIVDFRSRVFRYMRLIYTNRPLADKINSVFRAMKNIQSERKRVFNGALILIKKEVAMMKPKKCTYVLCSPVTCPFKERIKLVRAEMCTKRRDEFNQCVEVFKRDMLDADALQKCCAALESYILSDVENICMMYNKEEWLLGVEHYELPRKADYFESDRLCATLSAATPAYSGSAADKNPNFYEATSKHLFKRASSGAAAVLSEDFDCVVLFGADIMVKEVHKEFFSYITREDVMNIFGSTCRKDMIHKSCLMGTHFNLGLKGVGPIKAKKLTGPAALKLFETCMAAQSMDKNKLYDFFGVN